MIITTTSKIQGREIKETLGLVKGNTIRAKHIGKDIVAGFRISGVAELLVYGAAVKLS